MGKIKINMDIKANYNNLTTDVAIPSSYIETIDNKSEIVDINKYYREIAIQKWAEACEGISKFQYIEQDKVHIIFCFPSIEKLEQFQKHANKFINIAIQYIEKHIPEPERKSKIHIKHREKSNDLLTKPNYTDLTTIVTVPFPEQNCLLIINNICTIRNYCIKKRDETPNIQEKIRYDRVKAVCDWAEFCRANLESQEYEEKIIHLKFTFPNKTWLKVFEEKASFKINQYTINVEDFNLNNNRKK